MERFRCLKCNHDWSADADMQTCPKCQGFYVAWLSYEESRAYPPEDAEDDF